MVVGTPQSWELDARDGGQSSLTVLLNWLTHSGNYTRWQRAGKKKDKRPNGRRRSTRASLLQEIVALLHAEGLTHREERDVRSKIHDLEKAFWDAVAWMRAFEAERTRSGGGADRPRRSSDMHNELVRRCRHYDTLAPALLAAEEDEEDEETPVRVKKKATSSAVQKPREGPELQDDEVLALTSVSDRKLWGSDAVPNGSGKTSMDVLLDWLCAHYAEWHVGAETSTSTRRRTGAKEQLLRSIVDEMKRHGLAHRTTRDVRTKINELERNVRAAVAWRDSHGAAILQKYGDAHHVTALDEIRRGMNSVCKYFDRVGPAMVPLLCGDDATAGDNDAHEPTEPTEERGPDEPTKDVVKEAEPKDTRLTVVLTGVGRPFVPILPRKAATASAPQPTRAVVVLNTNNVPKADQRSVLDENRQPSGSAPDTSAVPKSPITDKRPASDVSTADSDESEQPARKKSATADALSPPQSANDQLDDDDKREHDRRCRALHEERLQLDVTRQQIQLLKEKALARHELRQAGVPEAEINRIFPLA